MDFLLCKQDLLSDSFALVYPLLLQVMYYNLAHFGGLLPLKHYSSNFLSVLQKFVYYLDRNIVLLILPQIYHSVNPHSYMQNEVLQIYPKILVYIRLVPLRQLDFSFHSAYTDMLSLHKTENESSQSTHHFPCRYTYLPYC